MKNQLSRLVQWAHRQQVWCYLLGLGFGAVVGLSAPAVAPVAEIAIMPMLALLLYATFLGLPFSDFSGAFKDWKFMSSVLVLNFVVVPVVVWIVSRIVAQDHVVLVGVLCVLLTPCVDYVIVFAGLAKGDSQSLLAAAPVLMIVQLMLLPVYLWLFLGSGFIASIEFRPFVDAFLWIIVVPLVLAALTQALAQRWQRMRVIDAAGSTLMVPLMTATLGVVVAAHIASVSNQLGDLMLTVPVYIAFAGIMVPVGIVLGGAANLGIPQQRSLVFSGITRNSLVILPLVLALPAEYSLTPLVVVTQTLIELLIMVLLINVMPRIIRDRSA
ncbi:MAG: arsenic resistance protein [Micrococcus sp.]|nr:arsenic resistance protein [Micrococcus sp.]